LCLFHLTWVRTIIYYRLRVGQKWQYACILLDLHNREIIGHSSGAHKDAALVRVAFVRANVNLSQMQMFHPDRGSEFNNALIDEILDVFNINRSLSLKGQPLDNAVAEATFNSLRLNLFTGVFLTPRSNWLSNYPIMSIASITSEFTVHSIIFRLLILDTTPLLFCSIGP